MDPLNPLAPMQEFIEDLKAAVLLNPKLLDKIGSDLVTRIRARVRLGYGNGTTGGAKSAFKPLAPATITHRTYLRKMGQLVNFSRPARSHLSATGKMMDSLTHKVDTDLGGVTVLFATEKEKRKATWNTNLGRPFMFLTKIEITAMRRLIEDELAEAVEQGMR
jgi:hypothetical protein